MVKATFIPVIRTDKSRGFVIKSAGDIDTPRLIKILLVEGRQSLKKGIESYKEGLESKACAQFDLGIYFLYRIANLESVELNRQLFTVTNDSANRILRQNIQLEIDQYQPIKKIIHNKKLIQILRFFNTFDDLKKTVSDENQRQVLNKILYFLLEEHINLFKPMFDLGAADHIKGIEESYLRVAAKIKSSNKGLEIGGLNFKDCITRLGIPYTSDLSIIIDKLSPDDYYKEIKEKVEAPIGLPDEVYSLTSDEIQKTLQEFEYKPIFTSLFIGGYHPTPFLSISSQSPVVSCQKPLNSIGFVEPIEQKEKQIEKTKYEKWKDSKSKEPFLIMGLTDKDISALIPSNKGEWKSIVSRYLQILNSGRLPHGDSSPKRGRLLLQNAERRQFPRLNGFLAESNISPMHLFSSQNILLRTLYSAYKQIAKEENPTDVFLEENLGRSQLVKIVNYLDGINSGTEDVDFKELTLMDPDFQRKVMSPEFLDALLDCVTKPATLPVEEIIATVVETEALPIGSSSDGVAQLYQLKSKDVEEDLPLSLPTISGIKIPIIDLLKPKRYKPYIKTGKLPTGDTLVLWYRKKKHLYNPHSEVHNEVHNYHNGNHIVRIIVQYSDGSTREISPYITDVRHAVEELKEKGHSTYNLKHHNEPD